MLPLYSLNKFFSLSFESEKSLSTKKYFKRISIPINNGICINDNNEVNLIGNIFLSDDIIKKEIEFPSYSINLTNQNTYISYLTNTKEDEIESIHQKKKIEKEERYDIGIKMLLNLEKNYINHFQFLPIYNQEYVTIQSIINGFQSYLNISIDKCNFFQIIEVKDRSICINNSNSKANIYSCCSYNSKSNLIESNITNELKYFIQNESEPMEEMKYSSIFEKFPEIIIDLDKSIEVENKYSMMQFNTNLKKIQRYDVNNIFNLPKTSIFHSNFQELLDNHANIDFIEKNDNICNWINIIENIFQCQHESINGNIDNNKHIDINKIDLFDMASIKPKLKSNYLFSSLISNNISINGFKKISPYSMMKHGVKSSCINNLLDKSPWRYIPVKSNPDNIYINSNIDNKNLINLISNNYYNFNISNKPIQYTESILNFTISTTHQLNINISEVKLRNKIINEFMGLVCGNMNLYYHSKMMVNNILSGENDMNHFISLSLKPTKEKEIVSKHTISLQNSSRSNSIDISKESKSNNSSSLDSTVILINDSQHQVITPKQITINKNNRNNKKRNINDDEIENKYETRVLKKTLLTPPMENFNEKETLTNISKSRNLSIDINNIGINENNISNNNFNIDNIEDNVKDYLILHNINIISQVNPTQNENLIHRNHYQSIPINNNQLNNPLANKFNKHSDKSNDNILISNNKLYNNDKIETDMINIGRTNNENKEKHDYGLQGIRLIISGYILNLIIIIYSNSL
jgi:hypothetical protein